MSYSSKNLISDSLKSLSSALNFLRNCRNDKTRNHSINTGLENIKDLKNEVDGFPWMVAFALRADGWYLRQDIIWHKPNPMPESVRDRCTKAREYSSLLSKSKWYYYDHEVIKKCVTGNAHSRGNSLNPKSRGYKTPAGSDTTGKVAIENGRKAILCEMNPEVCRAYQKPLFNNCRPCFGLDGEKTANFNS